jgi:hypothetical protein
MKRTVNADGTKAHKLGAKQVHVLLSATAVLEELAFFYRDTDDGLVLSFLIQQLNSVAKGERLTDPAPEEDGEEDLPI